MPTPQKPPSGYAPRWLRSISPRIASSSLATGVLGTHVGPGAWGIFYQVEDGLTGPLGQGGPQDG